MREKGNPSLPWSFSPMLMDQYGAWMEVVRTGGGHRAWTWDGRSVDGDEKGPCSFPAGTESLKPAPSANGRGGSDGTLDRARSGQPLPSWPCTPPALAPASEPLRFGHPRFFTARSKATEIPVDPSSSRFVRGARLKRPALAQHCLHLASSTYISTCVNHVRVFGYNIPTLFGANSAISMTTTIQRKQGRRGKSCIAHPQTGR